MERLKLLKLKTLGLDNLYAEKNGNVWNRVGDRYSCWDGIKQMWGDASYVDEVGSFQICELDPIQFTHGSIEHQGMTRQQLSDRLVEMDDKVKSLESYLEEGIRLGISNYKDRQREGLAEQKTVAEHL